MNTTTQITNIVIDPNVIRSIVDAGGGVPPVGAFTSIERANTLQAIYDVLSGPVGEFHTPVSVIEAVYSPYAETADCIYVDEEARLYREDEDHAWWILTGHPTPISGRGLVCGTDDEGESVDPKEINVAWLVDNVRFGWRDIELVFKQDGTPVMTQSPGCHVLDRWAAERRIVPQTGMEAMGLSTYGGFYKDVSS